MRLTVKKKTLEGFLDLELRVEDDEPEGYGEDIVASSSLEVVSEHVERIVVTLLTLDRGQVRSGASARCSRTPEDPGRVLRQIRAHCRMLSLLVLAASLFATFGLVGGEGCSDEGEVTGGNAYVTAPCPCHGCKSDGTA
jgi:hypothetical protein